MSELKDISSGEIYNIIEYEGSCITDDLYYPKSESDKVIAEKDKVITYAMALVREDIKLILHQKYKRCLAMARWCKRKRIDAADYRISRKKWDFYDKWYKRWLKIAEKFKEVK